MRTLKLFFSPILLLFLFILIGCESTTEPTEENSLYGSWQLTLRTGGFGGIYDSIDIKKNSYILQLNTDNEFSKFHNKSLTSKGTFVVTKGKTIFSQDSSNVMRFFYKNSDNRSEDYAIKQINNKLTLIENVYDGFSMHYAKIK